MRNLYQPEINRWRDRSPEVQEIYGTLGDDVAGVFHLPSPIDSATLRVIATAGFGWDHVSVSRKNRPPNWTEMDHIKRLFFHSDEVAMQLHVAESEHISFHPHCLHIWRPNDGREIPLPPSIMVAPR